MPEEKPWESAHVSELESLKAPGTLRWSPVRRRFGITAFGANAYTAKEAGQDVVEEHTERTLGHEELYVVLAGRARFTLGEEQLDAPSGTLVFIRDPGVKRHAVAMEAETTVLAVGGKPGQHEPSTWETFFAAYAYADEGELDRGLAELETGLAAKPDEPTLLYHLACLTTRAGRLDEARGYLDRAVELDPKFAEWAADDEDLEPLRVAGQP
jgi:tetratricopeptide (TPR) repeat protein